MSKSAKRGKPRPLEAAALWEYALRVLSSRAHSVSDLRRKLHRRAAKASDVAPIIAKLKEYGYLDDRRYAESYAASRLENKGFGKLRVLRDLQRSSIRQTVARQAVEAVFRDTDETELIENYLRRKYRKVSLDEHLSVPRNLVSAYRKLRYAGFGSASVMQVLRRFSEHADELGSLEDDPE